MKEIANIPVIKADGTESTITILIDDHYGISLQVPPVTEGEILAVNFEEMIDKQEQIYQILKIVGPQEAADSRRDSIEDR